MAARYFVNGGVDNNWGTTGNWSTSSGGAGGSSVPTSADDVFFDANSPNCTINTSARACRAFDATGFNGAITLTFGLTLNPPSAGVITFSATTAFAGAATLTLNAPTSATATITNNGITIGVPIAVTANSGTFTLADDMRVSGNAVLGGVSNTNMNGNHIYIGGNFSTGANMRGSTIVVLNGTGTWSTPTGTLELPVTINTSGTITVSGTIAYTTGTITYIAGTVVTTGSTLSLNNAANTTIDTNGMTWNAVTFAMNTATVTLLSNFQANSLTLGNASSKTTISGSFTLTIGGSVTIVTSNDVLAVGTPLIKMTNTGNLSWSSTGRLAVNVEFDALGKTITVSNPNWTGTVTYTAGTIAGDLVIAGAGSGGVVMARVQTGM